MPLTTIPEKTEESLGIVKQDVLPYTDPSTQVPAVQYERLKDAVIANALAIGLEDGLDTGSVVAQMASLDASRAARHIVFTSTAEGEAPVVAGAVYLLAGHVIEAGSRALLGTVGGGKAKLRLRAQASTEVLVMWESIGALADVPLGSPITVTDTDWYVLELLGDAPSTVSIAFGLHLI